MKIDDKLQKITELADFLLNPKRDIEVFGMFGPGNLGDEAMLVAAKESIPGHRCVPWQSKPNRPALNKLLQLRRRNHLLVAGGTLIHGGNTGWLDHVEMRSQQNMQVSFFGTGVAFNQDQLTPGYEPYRRWSEVLKRSGEVHVRGPRSVAICREMGARAEIFGDFAFLLHRPDIPVTDHGARQETIGLNFGNCLGDQEQFETDCVRIVRHLAASRRLAFHVVVDSDMEVTRRIIGRAEIKPDAYSIERHYFDPVRFMMSIREYSAFIGLKLHAAGLAMVAGVPALMVAYKSKCHDFMAPLGEHPDMLLNLPLDTDDVLARIDRMLSAPQEFTVVKEIADISARQRKTLQRVYSFEG